MAKREKKPLVATSLKMKPEVRRLVEQLTAVLTQKRQRLYKMSDVIEEAIRRLAQEQGVK